MRRIALLAVLAAAVAAQTPTIEQSLKLKSAQGAVISPDGRHVAYMVQQPDWEDNSFETEIWIASLVTGERYQLTSGKKSSSSPVWSPDSKRLAFSSDREGKRQIYLISPYGGEGIALTNVESGVNAFKWSPDGRFIAYTAEEPETKERKERKEKYGEFEVVKRDHSMTHLWLIPVPAESGEKPTPERLTEGNRFTIGGFSWAPDSERIAFNAARDPYLDSNDTSDIYVVRRSDKSVQKIVATKGPDTDPHWSPDGKQIAYRTANAREFFYYLNAYIAVVSTDGGTPRLLTESFDENPTIIEWNAEGIYFSAIQRANTTVFRVDPGARTIQRITGPEPAVISGFSLTKDGTRAAFTANLNGGYAEIYTSALKPFAPKPLTAMSEQLKGFRLARRELIQWKSADGTQIEGVLIKPADYVPSRRYPLLVVIHGGPAGVDQPVIRPDRYYPVEVFASKGALILRPNYRGSAGYGEKFRSLNVRNLGIGDYQDVISGVDFLIAKGVVDPQRVGAMGWSQGGYISAFITTFSDRFKAVSVGAGISNWMTYYVNTDIHPFTRQYLKATPWDDPEIYRKTSPISYVKTARTPTLIQHGELDKRVPIPNAYELYQALEDRGVPAKLIVYKGFGHGIDKPKQQRAVMEHNLDWFGKYIWGEDAATVAEGSSP
jgi:dipeptidyl aminopeptidase/acylaminoacyl peptidase